MPSFGRSVQGIGDRPTRVGEEPISGRRTDGLSGRRTTQRHPVVLAASAVAIDRSNSVVVSDLSHQGAKLRGRNLPASDQEVLITTGSFAMFATVVWAQNDECGLRFVPPLDDQALAQFQEEGKWATVMGVI